MASTGVDYLIANPDVMKAYEGNDFKANPITADGFAQQHYNMYGQFEGRAWGTPEPPKVPIGPTGPREPTEPNWNTVYDTPPPTLATVEPYRPEESETVEGRMNGLLASGSNYMTGARKAGERTTHARGLLESSLTTEASEKAAIEAALPIAQQDSASFVNAGMAGYQAALEGELVDRKASASSMLSAQEATQQLALDKQQQAGADYRQQTELDWKENISMTELGSQEKTAMANSMTSLGDNFQAKVAGIQVDPGLSVDAKTAAINDLQAAYQSNLRSLGSIYGVTISWGTAA